MAKKRKRTNIRNLPSSLYKCPQCGFHLQEKYRELLNVAFTLAQETNYHDLSTTEIAERAGVTRPLLNYYFGVDCIENIRKAVLEKAIELEEPKILAQAILYQAIDPKILSEGLLVKISKVVTTGNV